jgi:hypothetical protein
MIVPATRFDVALGATTEWADVRLISASPC